MCIRDSQHIDLLLCDVMMPKMDGFALTQAIRDGGSMMPILMLTAKALPEDKHTGFLVGTDDYMTKPPDRTELLLRIKALLRRARIVDEHKITVGDVVVDMDSRTVRRGMEVQTLPPKEFELLYKLLAYPCLLYTSTSIRVSSSSTTARYSPSLSSPTLRMTSCASSLTSSSSSAYSTTAR